MSETLPKNPEFPSSNPERISMPTAETIRIEMGDRIADIARVIGGDSCKERITRVARALGMTPRRVASYFYREIAVVPAHEADAIRACHVRAKIEKRAQLEAELEALRAELVAEASAGLVALVPPSVAPVVAEQEGVNQ